MRKRERTAMNVALQLEGGRMMYLCVAGSYRRVRLVEILSEKYARVEFGPGRVSEKVARNCLFDELPT